MKTLYIDVYFLINFIIDLLAIYFAVIVSVIPSTQRRLIIGALIGASFAVALVVLPSSIFVGALASVLYIALLTFTVASGVGAYRKIKFSLSFFIIEFLIGGFVQYFYGVLDKYVLKYLPNTVEEVADRRFLFLAIAILLCIGLLRILCGLFSSRAAGGVVGVEMIFRGRSVSFEAFCDTGNLAKDPFDLSPILIVKSSAVAPLFPDVDKNLLTSEAIISASLDYDLKKRIRVVPIKKAGRIETMLAIKPDSITVLTDGGKRREKISVTVAIDNEGGSYGGYSGLIPSAAIRDVLA